MKKTWAMVAAMGLGIAWEAMAQAVLVGAQAPAPVLTTPSGDGYLFLSELYHAGANGQQDRRTAVVLCFVEQDSAACAEVLPAFRTVASKVQSHEKLRGKARFYVVDADPLGRKDALAGFLARNRAGPPVLAFLDPYRKACLAFGVESLPRTFVISKDGILVADLDGATADYPKALARGVVKALKDPGSVRKPARVGVVPAASAREAAAETVDPDQPMRW